MVGLPFDCLANPLGAVRVTFEKAIESGLDPSSLSGKDWGAIDVFRQCLFDHEGLSQVPFLDSTSIHWIKPNTLVRCRGMVQDMLGNEFYVGAYKDGSICKTNKFSDKASSPMGSLQETQIWERNLFYCVPVPGQNSWTVPSSSKIWTSQQGEKRQREDDSTTDYMREAVDSGADCLSHLRQSF